MPESNPRLRFSQNFAKEHSRMAKRILDVGCGIGSYTALIDNENSFGIDLDVYAVKTAKKHCTRSNFLVASVLNLPFTDEIFDLIVMWEVIEHVPAKTEMQVFVELHRILAPYGAMILSTPNNHFISKMMDPAFVLYRHRHYNTKKIVQLIAESGFFIKQLQVRGGWNTLIAANIFYFYKHVLHKREGKVHTLFDEKSDREFNSNKNGIANLFIASQKIVGQKNKSVNGLL